MTRSLLAEVRALHEQHVSRDTAHVASRGVTAGYRIGVDDTHALRGNHRVSHRRYRHRE
jgi:hypothetical protein